MIYIILYLDHKLNKKCKCAYSVSIKIPLFVTILTYILYKLFETYIFTYIGGLSIIKQDIITDMVDF